MINLFSTLRALYNATAIGLLVLLTASVSCTTTYDSAGRPVQSVEPGTAVAAAAAVGVLGYAIAQNNDRPDRYRRDRYYPRRDRYYREHDRYHPRGRYHRYR